MSDVIVAFPQLPAPAIPLDKRLECVTCGAASEAGCNCGTAYLPAWKRAETAIAANPEKSDRMIEKETGISHATVSRVRKRPSTVSRETVEKRVGRDGKVRKMPKSQINGRPVTIPDGYKLLSQAIAAGIELEREGGKVEDVAKKLGFARLSYAVMRDIVLLAARKDLSASDTKIAKAALQDLDTYGQHKKPYKTVRPIVHKLWGPKGNRFKAEEKRLEAFQSSISFTLHACLAASEIELPHLNKEQRKSTFTDLAEAVTALRTLERRIKEEHRE